MTVIHIIFVLMLSGAALAVRCAGDAAVLNFVDYRRVADRQTLHKWVGNRMLVASLLAAAVAGLAWARQDLALVLFFVQMALVFMLVVAIAAGSARFTRGATTSSAV